MKRPLLTLLMASALALPVTAHAAGLSVGTSGSASGSTSSGATGSLSAGTSTSGSTSNSATVGSGFGTRTDLGKRQAIQNDSMARPNGPLNDPDTITSGTTTATGIDTNSNAGVNATSNTSTTNPNTTLGAGANTNTNTSTGIGLGLGNGTITGNGALSNGTAGSVTSGAANVANGLTTTANGNLRLDTARVRAVQTALKQKGYFSGSVDGRWGAATSRALQKFQAENRLTATGQADVSTLNELDINSHLSGTGAAAVNPAAR